ncbi:MAG: DNA-processing protein DprA [Puniceicoccales bacterium]|jgi:DNA processing protein|nr:DNA-processing protein DprA [Puniceicoccales bacterium]
MASVPSNLLDAALVFNAHGPASGLKYFRQVYDLLDGEIWRFFTEERADLCARCNFSSKVSAYLDSLPLDFDWVAEKAKIDAFGASFIPYGLTEYPPALSAIENGPIGIYVTGEIPAEQDTVAIVGSRKCTFYGEKLANEFAHGLASSGYTIVSGLAVGVDMAAHAGAIRAGGKTIAVLPGGLDFVYPPENRALYDEIRRIGVLMTECCFGHEVDRSSFSIRNRLITASACATIVIETATSGGSMISARYAIRQGKKLMAVPGPVGCGMSDGCHLLIRGGATLVTCVGEVLEILRGEKSQQAELRLPKEDNVSIPDALDVEEAAIWQVLHRQGAQSIDAIASLANLEPFACARVVQVMIIRGFLQKNTAGEVSLRGQDI